MLLSFLDALKVAEVFEKPEARTHRIWIESNRFFKFSLGFIELPLVLKFHIGERRMGFG